LENLGLEEINLNKNSKITATVAGVAIVIIALVATLYYVQANTPQTNAFIPEGKPPSTQLKITGDLSAEKTLSIADLEQMPLTSVTSTIKGETATYAGVTITQILNTKNASWDTGFIRVSASDGFSRTINSFQAYNSTQYPGNEYIIAFAKNGEWITDTTEGPLKLITPDLSSDYNVKNVAEINLQPWTITIKGSVTYPMTLTSSDIIAFGEKTVTAQFAPGGEPQRTSDWTGVPVSSLLEASSASSDASKITVTAIDGYSREFTIDQVYSTGMLIGYKENGANIPAKDGAPFRLFVPTEEFKWGQNWVRWVSEIIVS
jgi:DMSO/TMAO reductase YedYZ molybdopterin-dependent catalytic subunit